ncbi:MAG: hypothetical protein GF317_22460 [Candidatus Lokiarchaeota archaeon]|nr:hypothetical protein [Candidatus Lokiarchaeota archaeon]MBD3202224.1 hypothetical protein [Candidatus Lokiarchaeota archaeon]
MKDKVYCSVCERYVKPSRKKIDHKYHELWAFFFFLTFGIGFIIYLIIKFRKKQNTCPFCESVLDLSKKQRLEKERPHITG